MTETPSEKVHVYMCESITGVASAAAAMALRAACSRINKTNNTHTPHFTTYLLVPEEHHTL